MQLIDILKDKFPDSSSRTLRQWLKEGRILMNGQTVYKATLEVDHHSVVELKDKKPKKYRGMSLLYHDADIIVIEKPAGMLSVPQDIPTNPSALRYLRHFFKTDTIFPVHRLDKDASGVMIFAKSLRARAPLKELFFSKQLTRIYYAISSFCPRSKKDTIKSYLKESPIGEVSTAFDSDAQNNAKLAITHYRVVCRSKARTGIQFKLETGRKHQIRVHSASEGFPLLGDTRYGGKQSSRLFLHATFLKFTHPISKQELCFSSPPPAIFQPAQPADASPASNW